MNIDETNKDRRAMGLGPVSVIRLSGNKRRQPSCSAALWGILALALVLAAIVAAVALTIL